MHYDTFIEQVNRAGWHLSALDDSTKSRAPHLMVHSTAKLTHLGHTALADFTVPEKLILAVRLIDEDGAITDFDDAQTAALAMTALRTSREEIDHVADRIAAAAYTDPGGSEHLAHLRRVAQIVQPNTADYRATALLHDILKNTEVTEDSLALQGIPPRIIAAVKLLSRDPQIPDDRYYAAIRRDTIALAVKLAQIADHTDPAQLSALTPATKQRLTDKYAHTRSALLGERPNIRTW
ncbi:hypothetical protein [Mycobacteroides abscessus]